MTGDNAIREALRELAAAVIDFCENEVPAEWDGGSLGYAVGGLSSMATDAALLAVSSVGGPEGDQ